MDPTSCDFFRRSFEYLEAKQGVLFMESLPYRLHFKLILMFLKWFECFP